MFRWTFWWYVFTLNKIFLWNLWNKFLLHRHQKPPKTNNSEFIQFYPQIRTIGNVPKQQQLIGSDQQVFGRLPGIQTTDFPSLLLPVKWWAAPDPGPDEEPTSSTASSQQVFRRYQSVSFIGGFIRFIDEMRAILQFWSSIFYHSTWRWSTVFLNSSILELNLQCSNIEGINQATIFVFSVCTQWSLTEHVTCVSWAVTWLLFCFGNLPASVFREHYTILKR